MKRQNVVWLDGTLRDVQAQAGLPDGAEGRVTATVITDTPGQGGHHRVVLPGRLAVETLAFLEAAGGQGVEVTVNGWLCSNGDRAVVVVDRVAFHVGQAIRQAAARRVSRWLAQHQ